jgi:hypothetical protein
VQLADVLEARKGARPAATGQPHLLAAKRLYFMMPGPIVKHFFCRIESITPDYDSLRHLVASRNASSFHRMTHCLISKATCLPPPRRRSLPVTVSPSAILTCGMS